MEEITGTGVNTETTENAESTQNAETTEKKSKKDKKIVTPNLTDNELDAMAKKMGEIFKDMPKKSIRIPKDKQNPQDEVVPVCINGYIFQIKRGENVEVPEEVARILEESGYLG